jgi:GT2 family glycosyltransferase
MSAGKTSGSDAGEKHKSSGSVVQHSENERENLSSESAGREQGNTYQSLQITRLEERSGCESNRRALLRTRLFQTEQKLAEQTAELHRAHYEFQRVRNELERIAGTTAWRLIQWYWQLNMRLLPSGTRRRNIYDRATQLVSRILGLDGRGAGQPSNTASTDKREEEEFVIHCDTPSPGDSCAGTLIVRGRVISGATLQSVEILLDDQQIAGESAGHSGGNLILEPSGFFLRWDTNSGNEGSHILKIIAAANTGVCRTVSIPITIDQTAKEGAYQLWIAMNEPSARELAELKQNVKVLAYRPTMGILLRVRLSTAANLRITMESIVRQIYTNWEVQVLTEGSVTPNLQSVIADYAERDPRIKFQEVSPRAVSKKTSDETVSLPLGDFLGFVDEGDELAPDSLYQVARVLSDFPETDVIYSDEDEIDLLGRRSAPFFKPDWSPDLFLSMNYVSRFLILRRELVRAMGGVGDYDEDQRYGLILRAVERTDRIRHIQRVLYHKSSSHLLTSSNMKPKQDVNDPGGNAIREYLSRNNIPGRVEEGMEPGLWRVRYAIADNPRVSVIIACGPRVDLLRKCLDTVLTKTAYPNFEIMLVDNSQGTDVQRLVDSLQSINSRIAYFDYRNRAFNFSAINNFAVRQSMSRLVVFLNDDTEVGNEEWLSALVEHGQRPNVGVVGAKLIYPFGFIQHAGMAMGIHGTCGHAFKYLPADTPSYFGFAQIVRNCSCVTAACMLTKRDVFLKLGGFNEIELGERFQDPDYCLRVRQAGYLIVYTPYAILVHHESASKGFAIKPSEASYMQNQWSRIIADDPYYSPNLTRASEDYSPRV